MNVDRNQRVGEIAASRPAAVPIFEHEGIDFAARGNRTLDVACDLSGADLEATIAALNGAPEGDVPGQDDLAMWSRRPVGALIDFLTRYHRTETKELARINLLFTNLPEVEARQPAIKRVRRLFRSLSSTLPSHMFAEERELFPYIEKLELGERFETDSPVKNPVLIQYIEHDTISEKVETIRRISSNFAIPEGASSELRTLYTDLQEFERKFLRHLHLENNVLFPRGLELENALRGKADSTNLVVRN